MPLLWIMLHPRMTPDALGYIPGFLSEDDPRPAREQIDAHYQHGGGWCPNKGFTLRRDNVLQFPGDPLFPPLAQVRLRDELIVLYPHSYVAIIQPDRSFEAARVD